MKKMNAIALILMLVVIISACGIPDAIGGEVATDVNNFTKNTVDSDIQDKVNDKDELIDKIDETDIALNKDTVEKESVKVSDTSLNDARAIVKKFSSADFDVEEYDVDYCFYNTSNPLTDFSGLVWIEGIGFITLPCTYGDLAELGITCDYPNEIVYSDFSGDFDLASEGNTSGSDTKRVSLMFYNPLDIEQPLKNCMCNGVQFDPKDGYNYGIDVLNQSTNNISEVIESLGDPNTISVWKLEEGMSFSYGDDFESLVIETDTNGIIRHIWFTHN